MTLSRVAVPTVSAAFAHQGLNLEQLSVSFIADARYFFEEVCCSQSTWERLELLSLISRSLTRATDCKVISKLLQDASTAALHMPKMRLLEIWNGARGEACGFIYRKERYSAMITLRSTWDIKLELGVVHAWERVAPGLRFREHLLNCSAIKSHGDAIQQFGLPPAVIDGVSLWQICKEHRSVAPDPWVVR